jgi:hypothetical protein
MLLLGKNFLHKNGKKCGLSYRIFLHEKWRKIRYMKMEKNQVYLLQKMQVPGERVAAFLMFHRITYGVHHVLVSW